MVGHGLDNLTSTIGGYKWIAFDGQIFDQIEVPETDLSHKVNRREFWKTGEYEIAQYDKSKNLIKVWTDRKEMLGTLNIKYKTFCRHIRGSNNTCAGFIFKILTALPEIKLKKKVIANSESETLRFDSIADAAKHIEVHPSVVSRAISESKPSRGFTFSLG